MQADTCVENKDSVRRPDWVFSTAFALTMIGFLGWLLWFTLTRTSAVFP